jgi:hypothetical protein
VEAKDAARHIAAHANTARGQPITWLFGVDEKKGEVPGVSHRGSIELAQPAQSAVR